MFPNMTDHGWRINHTCENLIREVRLIFSVLFPPFLFLFSIQSFLRSTRPGKMLSKTWSITSSYHRRIFTGLSGWLGRRNLENGEWMRDYIINTKVISNRDLSSECWSIQFWGLPHWSGNRGLWRDQNKERHPKWEISKARVTEYFKIPSRVMIDGSQFCRI